jgi:hypothetical protein
MIRASKQNDLREYRFCAVFIKGVVSAFNIKKRENFQPKEPREAKTSES